jgi:serine/threonine protein kinase
MDEHCNLALRSRAEENTVDLQWRAGFLSPRAPEDLPPPSRVEIGRVLRDRYVIEKCLGSGGKGTVFKALDRYRSSLPAEQQYVAVKVLHPVPAGRTEMVESLQRELYCAQMLSHRNIVNAFELDRDGDIDFFTMELLEGELLSTVIARLHAQPMHRPHAWAVIRQIAAGVQYAHGREVVHADLKPQNIMITDAGEVRILDFGTSSVFGKCSPDQRDRSLRSATPAYASCEILDCREPDPRDDLYALACISYELLTGVHPFQRRRANDARDLGIVAIRPPQLSRRQWLALSKGLCWHRGGRSISVADWHDRLQPGGEPQPLPSPKDLLPVGPQPSRSALRGPALFAVFAAAAVASLLMVRFAPGVSAGSTSPISAPASASATAEALDTNAAREELDENNASNTAPAPTTPPQSPSVGSARSEGGRSRSPQMTHPIAISANDYDVHPGERFAEIRVHRSSGLQDEVSFVWWTEAASAKPGVDYVPQQKVTQTFPKGRSSTSFFVKLLPKASRIRPEVFYVAIGDAAGGPSLGQIVHTAVWLPSNGTVDTARSPQTAAMATSVLGTDVNSVSQ